jgi:hypothetical protein
VHGASEPSFATTIVLIDTRVEGNFINKKFVKRHRCYDSRDKWTIALRLGSKNCTEKLLAK